MANQNVSSASKKTSSQRRLPITRRKALVNEASKVSRRLQTNLKKLEDVKIQMADLSDSASDSVTKRKLLMEEEFLTAKVESQSELLDQLSRMHSKFVNKNRELEKAFRGITE